MKNVSKYSEYLNEYRSLDLKSWRHYGRKARMPRKPNPFANAFITPNMDMSFPVNAKNCGRPSKKTGDTVQYWHHSSSVLVERISVICILKFKQS